MKNIISLRNLERKNIETILDSAERFEAFSSDEVNLLSGKVLGSLFFEPSTRTRLSFETAMRRLGGTVTGFSGTEGTSVMKGENLSDTVRVIEEYVDVLVMRHPQEGSARLAADLLNIPVINGGDGANQHPTQTLLDLYAIRKFKGEISDLKVAIAGDLKYGRTTHSLAYALSLFGSEMVFIAPEQLKMTEGIKEEIRQHKGKYSETEELSEARDCDVLYMTRIQKERFEDPSEYEKLKGVYKVNKKDFEETDTTIMHPLPRVDEIAPEVDGLPTAKYFDQAGCGIPVRMALLALTSGVYGKLKIEVPTPEKTDLKCKNPNCITNYEPVTAKIIEDRCWYCEEPLREG